MSYELYQPRSKIFNTETFHSLLTDGHKVQARYISLAAKVSITRARLAESALSPLDLANQYKTIHAQKLQEYADGQARSSQNAKSRDQIYKYRTLLLAALLEQSVCVPLLSKFKPTESHGYATDLVDGIYGSIAHVLEQALFRGEPYLYEPRGTIVDTKQPSRETMAAEYNALKHEITSLALINRDQDPERIALPAILPPKNKSHAVAINTYIRSPQHSYVRDSWVIDLDHLQHTPYIATGLCIGATALGNREYGHEFASFETAFGVVDDASAAINLEAEVRLQNIEQALVTSIMQGNNFVYL